MRGGWATATIIHHGRRPQHDTASQRSASPPPPTSWEAITHSSQPQAQAAAMASLARALGKPPRVMSLCTLDPAVVLLVRLSYTRRCYTACRLIMLQSLSLCTFCFHRPCSPLLPLSLTSLCAVPHLYPKSPAHLRACLVTDTGFRCSARDQYRAHAHAHARLLACLLESIAASQPFCRCTSGPLSHRQLAAGPQMPRAMQRPKTATPTASFLPNASARHSPSANPRPRA
jgi:hypothetical protein